MTRAGWAGAGLAALLLSGVPAAPAVAQAAPVAPAADTPAGVLRALPGARLAGQGEFTWFGLSIYQAAFWVGGSGYQYQAATPGAAPFLLDLRYARALNGQKIAEASYDQMEKIHAGSPAQRQAWLQTMKTIFPNVHQGTHLSGLYLPPGMASDSPAPNGAAGHPAPGPGQPGADGRAVPHFAAAQASSAPTGTVRFYLDGKALAEVADDDFARAFFGIWLDPASSAPKLRAALLRNAAPVP